MIRSCLLLAASTLVLSACVMAPAPPYTYPTPAPPPPPPSGGAVMRDWRAIITPSDLERLQLTQQAWRRALDQAHRLPGEGDLDALGALIEPIAALNDPAPPPGLYRCRTVKMGHQGDVGLGYVVYGWFSCRIDQTAQGLRFEKLTGSQRPSGLLFPEDAQGMVFLGSLAMSDEPQARSYGLNEERDFAARFERIGAARWRLVVPFPEYESTLDIIELVPAN